MFLVVEEGVWRDVEEVNVLLLALTQA